MAISVNPLLKGIRGAINKQIVVKQYACRTVITKYPDMSRVTLSPLQKKRNALFADAVRYAKSILRNPKILNEYKKLVKPGERVYNHAIKAYLQSVKKENLTSEKSIKDTKHYWGTSFSIRRMKPNNTEDERRRKPTNILDIYIKKDKKMEVQEFLFEST